MKIILALLLVLLIFIFPQSIGAQELDRLQIFFYEIDSDNEDALNYYDITIPSWLSVENRALIIFSEIFDNFNPDIMIFVPPNVQILDVFFHAEYSHLVLNLSSDILNYGGTYFEDKLINKLLINAATIPEVGYFSVLIDGQRQCFPEGTSILNNSLALFNRPRIKIPL